MKAREMEPRIRKPEVPLLNEIYLFIYFKIIVFQFFILFDNFIRGSRIMHFTCEYTIY